jgi:hypothetical protein
MMPFGITVQLDAMVQDQKGNRTSTGATAVSGCSFMPGASAEDMAARDEVTEKGILVMPPGSPTVTPTHRITLPDGTVWEVDGTPSTPTNPFSGWNPGTSVPLKRTTG